MTGTRRIVVFTVVLAVASAGIAMASQQRPYRLSDQQLKDLVNRIDTHRDAFRASVERAVDRSPTNSSPVKYQIDNAVQDFEQATALLRERVNDRQSDTADADDVLRRASFIDNLMMRNQLDASAQRDWQALRLDMNDLARAYDIAWTWSNPRYTSPEPGTGLYHRLTGTYQLESSGGDDPRPAAQRAARAARPDQRQRTYQNLLTRLVAPELIAIERNGDSVTMASTRGQRVSVEVDGRDRTERWTGDRTISTRVTFEGERLVVATTGNRGSDFIVTFDPSVNGRSLVVTRTIDDESLRQPLTVRSVYRRTSDQAHWSIDAANERDPYDSSGFPAGDVVVPEGTRLVGVLDHALSTTNAREGDGWTMTARSPAQYRGAVIQGFVSGVNSSGRPGGSADMTLNLQSIRLRNGGTYQFDGVIESIRTPDGARIRVDREGSLENRDSRGDYQARGTVERGAIGAALGALIGAVAGGGKGAAIGAVVGAGVGAGTAIVEGRDRLDLQRGTELAITSGIPWNRREIRAYSVNAIPVIDAWCRCRSSAPPSSKRSFTSSVDGR